MIRLFLLFLVSGSLTHVVVDSYIFEKPRHYLSKWEFWSQMLSCNFCTGFWMSLVVNALAALYDGNPWTLRLGVTLLAKGLAFAWGIFVVERFIDIRTISGIGTMEEADDDEDPHANK